jgi:integrase
MTAAIQFHSLHCLTLHRIALELMGVAMGAAKKRANMGRKAVELGPLAVSKLTEPGMHFVGGVSGLALQVLPTGGRTWILRAVIGGKRRDMGLGGFPDVTLAGARQAARVARNKVREGVDPIEDARAARSRLKAERAAALTFKQCAEKYISGHRASWKNEKHADQWASTLQTYAYPFMGELLVRDVAVAHVLAALEPIWHSKTETASRVQGRIAAVLDWATARSYRSGENPARWKGHLDKLLPAPSKVAKVEHHIALPISDLGAFMVELRKQNGNGAKALEFAILTATRSGEVRGATWDEIDMKGAVWVIPAERMKAEREHRVPLSDAALALLKAQPRVEGNELIFPSPRGSELSDMTMTKVLRDMKVPAVPHGFRSTFRDWAAERTNYPRDVAEMALAHAVANKTEAAYRRGDLFEKRRRMMADWAAFCARKEAKGKVVPLNTRSAA